MVKKKKKSICDFEAYVHYRENNKEIATRQNIKNFVDYGKILSKFYKKVAEYLITSKDGVIIDGFGYFGIVNTNMKTSAFEYRSVFVEDEYNWETKGYCFSLFFMPEKKRHRMFKTFSLDYTFSREVKRQLSYSLKSGKIYNFNPQI